MTAGEMAVLMAAVLCCIGFAALIVVLMRVLDTMRGLQEEVRRLRDETQPLMRELRGSVQEASVVVAEAREDLERFDNLLGSAEALSDSIAGGSRIVRGALSAPMIKTVALASGTAKGAKRLRRRDRKQMRRRSTAS